LPKEKAEEEMQGRYTKLMHPLVYLLSFSRKAVKETCKFNETSFAMKLETFERPETWPKPAVEYLTRMWLQPWKEKIVPWNYRRSFPLVCTEIFSKELSLQLFSHRPLATRPHSLTAFIPKLARRRYPELMASDDTHTDAATAYILPHRDSNELTGKRLITTCRPREQQMHIRDKKAFFIRAET
jgi:hypothetical protein